MSGLKFNVPCSCGRVHTEAGFECAVGKGTVNKIGDYAKKYGAKKAFLFADVNTYPIAGDRICSLLEECGIACVRYIFPDSHTEPDERAVGSLVMHYDSRCDIIVGLGSGVMNDIGKILSKVTGKPYIIVGTAPSMDGYASGSSSMAMDGLKVSLSTRCPDVIIGDTDILKTAPVHMIKSGLGDMLAKYTSICEWRISNLINGEYYCEEIADYVRSSLDKCVSNASGILSGDEESLEAVFEGLIGCGAAMDYAGLSRPASGVEHYLSHIWDMRGLEFGAHVDLHGIQCAVASVYSLRAYEWLKNIVPDREKAVEYARNFDFEDWSRQLREFVGSGAEAMIQLEAKEQKYNPAKHGERLEKIIRNWEKVLGIIDEELPKSEEFERILDLTESPKSLEEIGIDRNILPMTLRAAKDIRDKYVLPRLMWDLGVLDEYAETIK